MTPAIRALVQAPLVVCRKGSASVATTEGRKNGTHFTWRPASSCAKEGRTRLAPLVVDLSLAGKPARSIRAAEQAPLLVCRKWSASVCRRAKEYYPFTLVLRATGADAKGVRTLLAPLGVDVSLAGMPARSIRAAEQAPLLVCRKGSASDCRRAKEYYPFTLVLRAVGADAKGFRTLLAPLVVDLSLAGKPARSIRAAEQAPLLVCSKWSASDCRRAKEYYPFTLVLRVAGAETRSCCGAKASADDVPEERTLCKGALANREAEQAPLLVCSKWSASFCRRPKECHCFYLGCRGRGAGLCGAAVAGGRRAGAGVALADGLGDDEGRLLGAGHELGLLNNYPTVDCSLSI